jgi:hypothetical protein
MPLSLGRELWLGKVVSVIFPCRSSRLSCTFTDTEPSPDATSAVDLNAIARTSGAFSQSPPETSVLSSSPVRNMDAVSSSPSSDRLSSFSGRC